MGARGQGRGVPPGYERFLVGRASAVALAPLADAVREALRGGTLYAYAAAHPERRELRGRAPVYAAPLPGGGPRVVVRHAWHGGAVAALTGDRFLHPTRAPHELAVAERLRAAGIATPRVAAYALYPAGPALRRVDVATCEIADGRDLVAALSAVDVVGERRRLLDAAALLLARLAAAGVRHPDLNLKNVLVARDAAGDLRAYVLDVDRVRFARPGGAAVARANLRRLERSARKWQRLHGLAVNDADLAWLAERVVAHGAAGAAATVAAP